MKKVQIVLTQEQRIDAEHWKFTFRGEERILPSNHVVYYARDMEDALNHIYYNEIESINVSNEKV